MKVITTDIEGLLIIEPAVFGDERGYFYESFRSDVLQKYGLKLDFVQDNQSYSHKGILRGLHFQKDPYAQGKLVRVINGAVLDVAVDIRKQSKTYGKHVSVRLDGDNKRMLYVPPGFAHGFVTLEDNTLFLYKCTNYYHKESEGSVKWDSPELGIDWGIDNPVLSSKDIDAPLFSEFISPF
jgi:dTDP-4-dehydrorhamnose 3,5-epimerase|tara:strand:- start:18694 stop:19236 length:543 start_codon:yes stop_codon:yes gene_type:complete